MYSLNQTIGYELNFMYLFLFLTINVWSISGSCIEV